MAEEQRDSGPTQRESELERSLANKTEEADRHRTNADKFRNENSDLKLQLAKLSAITKNYAPEGFDANTEIGFVAGLSVNDKGEIEGEANYRPLPGGNGASGASGTGTGATPPKGGEPNTGNGDAGSTSLEGKSHEEVMAYLQTNNLFGLGSEKKD